MGTEVLFQDDSECIASKKYIEKCHRNGELVWCNAIVYNYRALIAADHTDDRAMCGDPEGSWGRIADRGFDLMQTDRVLDAALFLEQTGRRRR